MKRLLNPTSSWQRLAACSTLMAAWASLTAYGIGRLWIYDATPGEQHAAPAAIVKAKTSDRFTLFVFLHPQCACSRASVAELAKLMADAGNRVDARVMFSAPGQDNERVKHTSLWDTAAAIPGVTVARDHDGELASRYGAATSGHVVLYRPDGTLAFSGGITASRGHEGDNVGVSTILSIVAGSRVAERSTPVFGCALSDAAPTTPTDRFLPSLKGGR